MAESVKCPQCGKEGDVPSSLIGKRISCLSCKYSFEALVPQTIPAIPLAIPVAMPVAVQQGYRYKMVQVPQVISLAKDVAMGNQAAGYLETVVNNHAREGWEFFRVDELGIRENPGCLSGFFGAQPFTLIHNVITFRRPFFVSEK